MARDHERKLAAAIRKKEAAVSLAARSLSRDRVASLLLWRIWKHIDMEIAKENQRKHLNGTASSLLRDLAMVSGVEVLVGLSSYPVQVSMHSAEEVAQPSGCCTW